MPTVLDALPKRLQPDAKKVLYEMMEALARTTQDTFSRRLGGAASGPGGGRDLRAWRWWRLALVETGLHRPAAYRPSRVGN